MDLKSFLQGKHYIGFEHFQGVENEMIAKIWVDNKNGELFITNQNILGYQDAISIKDSLVPSFIILNTNEVIQKEIDSIDKSDEKLLNKVFPNLPKDEFYFEIWRLEEKSLIAIARKSYVDNLLGEYRKKNQSIMGVSLGNCSLSLIAEYLKNQSGTSNKEINLLAHNRKNSGTESYEINGLLIETPFLLAFTGALRLAIDARQTSGNLVEINSKLSNDQIQKQIFRYSMRFMVASLLTILLINFFFFTHFFQQNLILSEKQQSESLLNAKLSETKKRVLDKEKRIAKVVGLTQTRRSALLNLLAKKIPSTILLDEMVLNPLEKQIKPEEKLKFIENNINISGITINNADLTLWIDVISKLNQVDKVVITSFGKDETGNTSFSLKISLK